MISRAVFASGFGSPVCSFIAGSFLVFLVHFSIPLFNNAMRKKPDTDRLDMEGGAAARYRAR